MKKLRILFCIGLIFTLIPLTGCKILKLPVTIVKSVGKDIGEAVGIIEEEETSVSDSEEQITVSPEANKSKPKGSFKGLAIWSVIIAAIMIFVRLIVKRRLR